MLLFLRSAPKILYLKFLGDQNIMHRDQLRDALDNLTLKGTTTVGVVCNDGVILSTDTRATMGYFIAHKNAKKVYKIDDHLAMTIAGAVGDAQKVVEILRANSQIYKYSHETPMPIGAAARLVANILYSSRMLPLMLQTIIGGMDNTGSNIFTIDPLGSLTKEKCVATGSGSPVAYGVLESDYKDDMNVKEALPVIIRAVNAAMKRDAASGDNFDVALVTKEGYKELSKKEKQPMSTL